LEQYKRLERSGNADQTLMLLGVMTDDARPEIRPLLASWLDEASAPAVSFPFWRRAAPSVLEQFAASAAARARQEGIEPTDDDIGLMAGLAFLNLVYTVQREPSAKAFVQKALGIGLFGRLFG